MVEMSSDHALQFQIERVLYREARLLDEMRFEEWLEWVSPGIRYWMPVRAVRKAAEIDREYGRQGSDVGYLDEDYEALRMRVQKYRHIMSWSDNPAARVVRAVSNVEAGQHDDGSVQVRSVVVAHRARFASQNDTWHVIRNDLLFHDGETWKLSYREVLAPENMLRSSSLDILF